MSEPKGQILPDSEFGELLTELAKKCERIVEIGTWHGQGSTLCLFRGLVRMTQLMWTIEQDETVWREAKGYYKDKSRIMFLNMHGVDAIGHLPTELDFILFDGHDEQTDGEFDLYLPRLTRFVALDDTNVRKNARQLKLLRDDLKWTLIKNRTGDRNGWAVFEKP